MKVTLTENYDGLFVNYKSLKKGQIYECSDFQGSKLVAAGLADAVVAEKPKAKPRKPRTKKAAKK